MYKEIFENIISVQNKSSNNRDKKNHKCPILVISDAEDYADTKKFFKEMKYFGANKQNIIFCQQGMVPSVDLDGKIIMKSTSQI